MTGIQVNYAAVAVSALASIVPGALWYSPLLSGKPPSTHLPDVAYPLAYSMVMGVILVGWR